MVNLKNYICTNPFQYTEIMEDRQTFCCPQWLEEYFEGNNIDYRESWSSNKANDIRDSILDGSFKYCSTDKCPHLSTLLHTGNMPRGPLRIKTDKLVSQLKEERVEKTTDVVKEGDVVKVKVIGVDDRGKVKLSIKDV